MMNAFIRMTDILDAVARSAPDRIAFANRQRRVSYARLQADTGRVAVALQGIGIEPGDRVATFVPKAYEAVVMTLAVNHVGAVLVPINPQLKEHQVRHILTDSGSRLLLLTQPRLRRLREIERDAPIAFWFAEDLLEPAPEDDLGPEPVEVPAVDSDPAAILYTSGSTGSPKGVVLSQRNLVAGARSVAAYQRLARDDVILGVLPLSFDAGLSQLTSAMTVGACYAPLDFLQAEEVPGYCEDVGVTSITAVPPLWMQLAAVSWPRDVAMHIRRFASTGGHMPTPLLERLRRTFINAKPYLMYGQTEAFRSTWLAPEDADTRPDSIGKAVPNAQILVVRPDGSVCEDDEPGELVHRGAFVTLGYWNSPELTAQRFRPLPPALAQIPLADVAVWSSDIVRRDRDGYLYFVARADDMIKTSGYRVSPTEVEDVLFANHQVVEAAVFGVPDERLGQAIVACVCSREDASACTAALLRSCRENLPTYMVPSHFTVVKEPLPRNPNGKIDRGVLKSRHEQTFRAAAQASTSRA